MIMNLYSNDDINFVDTEMSYFGTIPLLEGFRFLGWSKDCTTGDEPVGYESTDGFMYVPIFIKTFCNVIISDEEDREQIALDKGKNTAIFVHGQGEESYVLRYTSKEIKLLDLSFFDDRDVHEGFFYRS